jgi:hypothetical protein
MRIEIVLVTIGHRSTWFEYPEGPGVGWSIRFLPIFGRVGI